MVTAIWTRTSTMTQSSPQPQQSQTKHHPKNVVPPNHFNMLCSDVNDNDLSPGVPDTKASSNGLMKSSSIIHGFSPSQISYSRQLHPPLADDTLLARCTAQPEAPTMKWNGQIFTSGGSSWGDESSLDERIAAVSEARLRISLSEGQTLSSLSCSPSGFAIVDDKVESGMIKPNKVGTCTDDGTIEPDDEEVSECLVDNDDDSSDWEELITESQRSSVDENKLFQWSDSQSGLVSRKSLLSAMMHQSPPLTVHPPKAISTGSSRSSSTHQRLHTPRNDPSLITSQDDDGLENTLINRGLDIPCSKPITATPPSSPVVFSPCTSRKNMLADELDESLREHMHWEHQEKDTTANAVFNSQDKAHTANRRNILAGRVPRQI